MLSCRRLISFAVVVQIAALATAVMAQQTISNYAAGQLSAIKQRNSPEQYSVDQIKNQVKNQSIPRAGVRGVNLQNFARQPLVGSGGMAGGSKPFSRIDRGPTVSPYLSLNNPFSTAEDYYNIVRPLQEQRRTNDAVAQQQYMQQRKLNQIAAQGPFQITGDPDAAPTGHGSGFMRLGTYMNTGGYFAPPTQPKSARGR
jgi:hypothetical protein